MQANNLAHSKMLVIVLIKILALTIRRYNINYIT